MRSGVWSTAILGALLGACALAAMPLADEPSAARPVVNIRKMKYVPAAITIRPGQTVRWVNNDDFDHTVEADDDSFKSGNIRHGETYEHRFDRQGRYPYSCTYHPRMKGVVIVSEKAP